jgi:hypothetical protein
MDPLLPEIADYRDRSNTDCRQGWAAVMLHGSGISRRADGGMSDR